MNKADARASHEFSIARREKRVEPSSEALHQGGLVSFAVGILG
jgi:hypothetical protein